jgi:hypothetical protein
LGAQRYLVANGPMATTAALAKVTTGTSIKTMLQIATSAGNPIAVEEWGIFFDGTTAATPIQCELVETGSVAATVTAHVAAGVQQYDYVSDGGASTVTLSTTATGYTASAEGTVTATRYGDVVLVPPTSGYQKMFPLGKEFFVPPSRILRVRVTAGAAVNCSTYVIFSD